jgi:hypothetical protein
VGDASDVESEVNLADLNVNLADLGPPAAQRRSRGKWL